MLTSLHALAALNADHGLGCVALRGNADAGQVLVKLLIKSLRAGLNALQACHADFIFLDSKLFH
jgi:hypothetical protein